MYLKGESKLQIKKITLEDGRVIDLDNSDISYVLLIKEGEVYDHKENSASIDFDSSYKIKINKDLKPFSNSLFMYSNIFRLMHKQKLTFEGAFKIHAKMIKDKKNKF